MSRVLITGASSGIGLELARDYAADGWQVIACGRNRDKLEQALEGLEVMLRVFDSTDQAACHEALLHLPPVDLAILAAGTCDYIDDPQHIDADLFTRVIQTNLLGTLYCLTPLLASMQAGGRIAVVSSSVTFVPLTRAEAYGASKAALDYLVRTLAIDLAQSGIALSLIRPGFVDTPLTQKNDFPMPGRISVAEASAAIRKGLARGQREISFPFGLISILRLLSWLPQGLWHRIGTRLVRPQKPGKPLG